MRHLAHFDEPSVRGFDRVTLRQVIHLCDSGAKLPIGFAPV
jgi:hypothetical protein